MITRMYPSTSESLHPRYLEELQGLEGNLELKSRGGIVENLPSVETVLVELYDIPLDLVNE
jgi:hypothetical protein